MDQKVMGSEFGVLNGHAVGRIVKETMRRAMVVIANERFVFEAQAKEGYGGSMDDVFTSADTKAQEIYLRGIQECFPDWGIRAEEDNLSVEPKNGCRLYATVDPLDGTKAYTRRQSHGVGSMFSLVEDGKVVCAYVGDVNTNELYGYRPGSSSVWRISRLDTFERLEYSGGVNLSESYVLLRDPPEKYKSRRTRETLEAFKNYEVSGGSIGTWAARLWKREVAALIIPPGWETPWDSNPVIGISKKLGYLFYKSATVNDEPAWKYYEPTAFLEKERREEDLLIIHDSDADQLMSFLNF